MTDPLADMLTRIRNGQQAKLYSVESPYSDLRFSVLEVLKSEGYITDFEKVDGKDGHPAISIVLKYHEGKGVISVLKKISKPGRRVYSKIKDLQQFYNGLGVVILSTSKGVMADHEARKENLGGEVLCNVF